MIRRGVMRKLNVKGFSIPALLAGVAVGTAVMTALGISMQSMFQQVRRMNARMELISYVQQVQTSSLRRESCEQMMVANTIDLGRMAQSYNDTSTPLPGAPVSLTLLSTERLQVYDPGNPGTLVGQHSLVVENLTLTDGRVTNRNGPNGFPLHQAILFGRFGYLRDGQPRTLINQPLATLFIEVDPTSNQLLTCFTGTENSAEQAAVTCENLGGTWDGAAATCSLQSGAPVAADSTVVPSPDPVPTIPTGSMGADCTMADGTVVPAGTVRTVGSTSPFGGSAPTLSQCINGGFVQMLIDAVYLGEDGA